MKCEATVNKQRPQEEWRTCGWTARWLATLRPLGAEVRLCTYHLGIHCRARGVIEFQALT